MVKRLIKTEMMWVMVKKRDRRVDYFYGFRDKTPEHGHLVVKEGEIAYERQIQGLELKLSEENILIEKEGIRYILIQYLP